MFADSKVRKRIDVQLSDLSYPGASPVTLKAAHQIIQFTNQDDLNYEFVLGWGAEPQIAHEALLQRLLNSAVEKEAGAAKSGVLGIVGLLESIDLEGLHKTGIFQSRESKLAKLNDTLSKVRVAGNALVSQLPTLKQSLSSIDGMEREFLAIQERLEPYIISCDFFTRYQQPGFPNELFVGRLSSLLNTKVTIQSNLQQRAILEQAALNLVTTIQDTIRTDIPSWLSAVIGCLTSGHQSGTLALDRSTLISKLKSTL